MENALISLTGENLTLSTLISITRESKKIKIADEAIKRICESRQIIENKVKQNETIYGVTTGFGKLANTAIEKSDLKKLQANIIKSHSIGFGSSIPDEIVLGAMVIAVNSFCKGNSGIRLETVNILVELINRRIIPQVPETGSLGASGDLAPLAYIACVFLGEGYVKYNDTIFPSTDLPSKFNITPLELEAKEGLALVNGTHVLTSYSAHSTFDAMNIIKNSAIAVALSLEAYSGNLAAFSDFIMRMRPHKGQIIFAKTIRELTKGSEILSGKRKRVQDPYSFRCSPQVHGAVLETITYSKNIIEIEMNSSTDNPLINKNKSEVLSGGNFHGEPVGLSMDYLAIALTELGTISERRVNQLLNTVLSDLPPFLTDKPGLNSGLMILQYADAAISSENKVLASPASIDNTPVSADQEDHVSMGMTACKKAYKIVKNLEQMIGIEIYTACQALTFIENNPSPILKDIYDTIREVVTPLRQDRKYDTEVYWIIEKLKERRFTTMVKEKLKSLFSE